MSFLKDQATRFLAGNTLRSLLIRLGGVALTLVAYMLLARSMSGADYGSFIYFVTWAGILSLIGQSGFSASILRYFHEYRGHAPLLRGYLRASIFIPATSSIALCLALVALESTSHAPDTLQIILPYLPPAILGFTLTYVAQAGLKADHRIILSQIFEQIGLPLSLLLLAGYGLLFNLTHSLLASASVYIGVFFMTAAITWTLLLRRSYPASSSTEYRIKEWLASSLPMAGSSLVAALMSRLDILALGFFVSAAEVGEYGVAARVAALLGFLYAALSNALVPTISQKFQAGDMSALDRLIPRTTHVALGLTLIGFGIIIIFGEWILSLFGPNYVSAAPLLMILAIAQTVNLYAGPGGSVLLVTGHQKAYFYFTLCFASLLALGLWIIIPNYGLMGAALVTLSTTLLLNVALLISIKRLTGIRMI